MKLRMAVALALLGTSASFALAQTTTAPSTTAPSTAAPSGATTAAPAAGKPAHAGKYGAIQAVKIPLVEAVEVAEKITGKGEAVEVEFDSGGPNQSPYYEIKVLYPDGKFVEQTIDANTGAVLKTENKVFDRYFSRLKPSDLQAAKTSLRDAVGAAEKAIGNAARAVEAEIEKGGSDIIYEIELASPVGKHEVKVDSTGKVVKQ
ncbi:PepSY domain-containing protein [Enterovirga sp. CN4-39]|uniref:PepSY domain-containing protein n=1 Tax=Enterovirga sp. CN4-39 TaxID=3400910 RepID=UPI003C09811B